MTVELRQLTADDSAAAWTLTGLAFGYVEPMPEGWDMVRPGRSDWGAFDPSGRLLAKAIDREQGHWFGGRVVPASGVAGVAVVAEHRGGGHGRSVLTRLLAGARERGAVISTLFPTTEGPYRRLGWEEVGALVKTGVPTAAFEGLRAPPGRTVRPAEPTDVPAIEELYRTVARDSTGLMDRSGPAFEQDPEKLLGEWHGVSVVDGPDGLTGYCSWDRGPGYDAAGIVTVGDLVGLDPDTTRALLSLLGGWASVAPTIVLRQPPTDPAYLLSGAGIRGQVRSRQPWMLRLVDVAGAVAARGWPAGIEASIDVTVTDPECPWNDGEHRLVVQGGAGRLEAGRAGGVRFGPRGLALWYAGAATPAMLRRAGLLEGPATDDALLSALTAGPAPTLFDYF